MSKTAVSTLMTSIKRKADYNISDTELDALIVDEINDALKLIKQWLLDAGLYMDIGAQDSFATVASQNYVAISTETVDFDESVILYEKTNDQTIDIIPYDEFVELYPDATANTSATPDYAAFFAGKVFLGPTPSGIITLYMDYVLNITEVTSASTCPFNNKYDPLIKALCVKGLTDFLEPSNANRVTGANRNVEFHAKQLIHSASRNLGQRRGTASRKPSIPYFAPRKVVS